jgi:DNA-binding beta-propeller fold protein YncE
VYFAVSGVLTGKVGNQVAAIYSLPNLPTPSLNDLRLEYQFEDAHAIPDGLAFSESGKLYVTVAGQNSIVVLEKQGQGCQFVEVNRFSGPISVIGQKMKIPFDAPAVCAFDDRIKALYVANHALLSCDSSHFCVFAVYTGEKGYPLFYPCLV